MNMEHTILEKISQKILARAFFWRICIITSLIES